MILVFDHDPVAFPSRVSSDNNTPTISGLARLTALNPATGLYSFPGDSTLSGKAYTETKFLNF